MVLGFYFYNTSIFFIDIVFIEKVKIDIILNVSKVKLSAHNQIHTKFVSQQALASYDNGCSLKNRCYYNNDLLFGYLKNLAR